MQRKIKYTLTSFCLIGILFSKEQAYPAQEKNKEKKVDDSLSVKRDFVGIGPIFYELPPEKTKEQLLEERYEKKRADASFVAQILEEKRLNTLLAQVGTAYPNPSNVLDATFTVTDLENSLQRSLQSYLQLDNKEMVSNLQNRLGIIQTENRAYEKAINNFQRALTLKEELKDLASQVIICNNLAAIYDFLDNTEQAFTYYDLMNRLAAKARDLRSEAIAIEKLAILKAHKGQYHAAEQDIIKRVLPLYGRLKNASGKVAAYNSLAAIYLAEEKYTESRWFHLQAVKVASMNGGNHRDMSYSLYHLGRVKKLLKEYNLAIRDYMSAATYATQTKDELLSMCIYDDLGDIYIQTKNYEKASSYLEEYDNIKNKIISLNAAEKTVEQAQGSPVIAILPSSAAMQPE